MGVRGEYHDDNHAPTPGVAPVVKWWTVPGMEEHWRAFVDRRLGALEARVAALEDHSEQLDRIEQKLSAVLQVVNALLVDPQQLSAATANLRAHTERLQDALNQANKK